MSLQLKGCPHCFQKCHKSSQTYYKLSLFIYGNIIFLGFFDLKSPKWYIFEAINENYFVKVLTCPSMFLYNQSKLTTFAKCFVERAVTLLLRSNCFYLEKNF